MESVVRGGDAAYAVAGIGINVNFDTSSSSEIASTATSIMVESGRRADRGKVLKLALEGFDDLYRSVSRGGSLTQDWAAGLETLGRHVRVEWKELVVEGHAESVDEHGNLLLRTADGSTFTASQERLRFRPATGTESRGRMLEKLSLDGKGIVITGGGTGLGREMALAIAGPGETW